MDDKTETNKTKKVVLFHVTRTEYLNIPEDAPTATAREFEAWLDDRQKSLSGEIIFPDSFGCIPKETIIQVEDSDGNIQVEPQVILSFDLKTSPAGNKLPEYMKQTGLFERNE